MFGEVQEGSRVRFDKENVTYFGVKIAPIPDSNAANFYKRHGQPGFPGWNLHVTPDGAKLPKFLWVKDGEEVFVLDREDYPSKDYFSYHREEALQAARKYFAACDKEQDS